MTPRQTLLFIKCTDNDFRPSFNALSRSSKCKTLILPPHRAQFVEMSEKSVDKYSADQVEAVERRKSVTEEVTELSGIEATAASTAAWLISITVSIGGFLFGQSR